MQQASSGKERKIGKKMKYVCFNVYKGKIKIFKYKRKEKHFITNRKTAGLHIPKAKAIPKFSVCNPFL